MAKHTLRSIFDRGTTTIAPGAGSPLDVLLIEKLGFELAYLSGYCVAAQRYGVPDIGLMAFREMRETVEAVCDVTSIPMIVDCDTGYGDVLNVRAAVRAMEQAGASALQFEDQTWPKRCGHMQAKTVEPIEVLVRKIRAAVDARQNDDLVIIARTDAEEILGFDEALRRCKAYKQAGADVVMMHGAHSREHRTRLAAEIPGVHFASIGEGEQDLSFEELKALGYQIVILPSSPLRHSLHTAENYLTYVRDNHEVGPFAARMYDLDQTNRLVNYGELQDFEKRARM